MKEEKNKKSGIARLLEIAGRKKGLLFVSGFLSVMHALLSLVPYVLVFYIIRELTKENINFSLVNTYVIYAILAAIISMLVFFLSGVLSHIAAYNILFELRKFITAQVGKLPMGYLNNRNSGTLKKILSDDVERIENFIAHQIPDFVKGIALPIITIVYLFFQDWRLAAISCVPLLVLAVMLPKMYSGRNKKLIQDYHQSLEEMNAGIVEYVRAMPVMKIFGQSAETFDKYGNTIKRFNKFVGEWVKSSTPGFAIFMSFTSNAMLPVLALGLYLYFQNGVTLATLLLFLILGTGYIKPLFALNNMGIQISIINRGVEQIDELLYTEHLLENAAVQHPIDYSITFEHVSFAYQDKNWGLQNINFTVPEKTITALVGPSGAGKSTIGQLLARFWDVTKGEIRIGGIDVRDYPTEQLMRLVSFVFQDSFMFQDTMYENICMGMKKSREEVEDAAKAAQIHDLILSLPNGYDTLFGQSGVHLSGGEQQRFQLARAILKDAPILILDEATAFADPENEIKIQQAFSQLIKDKTVLIIAHRLSTITDADQILVFDHGELIDNGKHDELLENSALYGRMWNAHTRAKEFVI
ncbi:MULTISPECIES: ABC transporter ATP-binding protein [unclassified Sphingobacterium]|uniref:ABC transporter ATP-binding protein n=1 Tax=unclassified Sphingobacterium TaxID=2609468 RepID=UPI0010D7B621|nr:MULTISPECIES: ABC transporter ATP-binding protein [unclassified Sphingobacterium]MCS3552837.1 ATP-binding cassette subfamily B protein [Sphingobacterium sp. JUb21]TCR10407.1 ATP-binding cassette subfamily B protein [Sphingobacterium sp. JUb20]